MTKTAVTICSLLLMLSGNQLVHADDYNPESLIKYRQESMEAIKSHNNAIELILQNKVPYKDQLGSHMAALEKLITDVGSLFPEGSDFGETNAKDAVWDNPDKFEATVKDAQQALATFKAVLSEGDDKASAKALKQFGKDSCGSCHKSFKKKDD